MLPRFLACPQVRRSQEGLVGRVESPTQTHSPHSPAAKFLYQSPPGEVIVGAVFRVTGFPLTIPIFITNFGNLAVLLPIAAAVLAWLSWSPETRRLGVFWAIALALCGGTIGLLKVYFWDCPTGPIRSPSGHSGLSLLVYGGLACLTASQTQRFTVPAIAAGFGLALGIAVSRIIIGDHNPVEVLIGLAIGGAALAIFASALTHNRAPLSIKWLLIIATVLAVIVHGQHFQAEQLFHLIGGYLYSKGLLYCLR